MFGRKDQYYQQKGISSLMLTAGNIFSTCIVLQNVSVYWTELTFERTLWVQTVLRFPTNSLCTVELAFNEVQTLAVKNLTYWFASSHDGYAILMSPNKGGEKAVHMAATAGVIYDCGQE